MTGKKVKLTTGQKVSILAAIIGVIGTVTAAVINIVPDISKHMQPNTPSVTETSLPVTFTPLAYNRYDDPSGMFSIELPNNLILTGRNKDSVSLDVQFDINRENSKKGDIFTLDIRTGVDDNISDEYPSETIENLITNSLDEKYFIDMTLISSEKTDKGFIAHSQSSDEVYAYVTDTYYLVESQNSAYFLVVMSVQGDVTPESEEIVEHIFSTVNWDPSKVDGVFNP